MATEYVPVEVPVVCSGLSTCQNVLVSSTWQWLARVFRPDLVWRTVANESVLKSGDNSCQFWYPSLIKRSRDRHSMTGGDNSHQFWYPSLIKHSLDRHSMMGGTTHTNQGDGMPRSL